MSNERKLAPNTQKLLAELKKANVGDYLIRAREALAKGDIDSAASTVAALANLNRGVYDHRRIDAFKTARTYFRYGNTLEEALKRVCYSDVVWEYLEEYLKVENPQSDNKPGAP